MRLQRVFTDSGNREMESYYLLYCYPHFFPKGASEIPVGANNQHNNKQRAVYHRCVTNSIQLY